MSEQVGQLINFDINSINEKFRIISRLLDNHTIGQIYNIDLFYINQKLNIIDSLISSESVGQIYKIEDLNDKLIIIERNL